VPSTEEVSHLRPQLLALATVAPDGQPDAGNPPRGRSRTDADPPAARARS